MEREQAIRRLRALQGRDMHAIAEEHGVCLRGPSGKINKGWAGHAIESYLGLPLNSSRKPDFGSWELKVIPLKKNRDGQLRAKETMAITMIKPEGVLDKDFANSHLLAKMRSMVIVLRTAVPKEKEPSIVQDAVAVDIPQGSTVYEAVKADYEEVRKTIRERGFAALTGKMGTCIQPRTKGAGHGSTSRAFYARRSFLDTLIFSP